VGLRDESTIAVISEDRPGARSGARKSKPNHDEVTEWRYTPVAKRARSRNINCACRAAWRVPASFLVSSRGARFEPAHGVEPASSYTRRRQGDGVERRMRRFSAVSVSAN